MSSTHRGATRAPRDYYGTPAWATDAILPHLPRAGRIVDAGAGEGQIAVRLLADGVAPERIVAVEIDAERAASCAEACPGVRVIVDDFLHGDVGWMWEADTSLVIMNPPYDVAGQPGCTALAFVRNALRLVGRRGTVAALLRLNWLEGAQVGEPERLAFLQEHMPDAYVLSRRPQFGLNKHGKRGGDSCAYAWMVWGPGRAGRLAMLHVPAPRALASKRGAE